MRKVKILVTILYQTEVTLIGLKLAGKSVERCGLGIADNNAKNISAVVLSSKIQAFINAVSVAAKQSLENNYYNNGTCNPHTPGAAEEFISVIALRISLLVIGVDKVSNYV